MSKRSNLDVIFALALKWHFTDSMSFFFQDIPVQSATKLPIFFFDCLLSFLQTNSKTWTWNFCRRAQLSSTPGSSLGAFENFMWLREVAGICRKHSDFWMLVQNYCFDFCGICHGSDKLWQMNKAHQCPPIWYLDLHYQSRSGIANITLHSGLLVVVCIISCLRICRCSLD